MLSAMMNLYVAISDIVMITIYIMMPFSTIEVLDSEVSEKYEK